VIAKRSLVVAKSLLLRGPKILFKALRNFDLSASISALKALKLKWLGSITTKASNSASFGKGRVAIKSGATSRQKVAKKDAKK